VIRCLRAARPGDTTIGLRRRRLKVTKPVTVLAVAGMAALSGGPAMAATLNPPLIFPAVQVSTDLSPSRAYNEPNMLVDPKDPHILVIAGANYNAGTCVVFVSRDTGRTWSQSKAIARPSQYTTCVRADLGPYLGAAFGADGTLYIASAADSLGGQQDANDLYLARSTDLGDTWQFTIIHKGEVEHQFPTLTGTTHVDGEHYSLVQIATDPSNPGYVYVGARYGNANRTAPFGLFGQVPLRSVVAVSSDGGKTFTQPMDIMSAVPSTDIYGDFIPTLAVGATGTVYAFTREQVAPLAQGAPAATATSPPGTPGDGPRQLVSVSTDHGKTWTLDTVDSSAVHCPACTQNDEPSGAVSAKGSIYETWAQSSPEAGSPTNILFTSSTDGGKTWVPAMTLNDDKSAMDHAAPGISVAPNGRIDVAWLDFRPTLAFNPDATRANEQYWNVYYTYSTDGGHTWAKNMAVDDRPMDKNAGYTENSSYGLQAHAALMSTDDVTYFALSDSRAGTTTSPVEDYYFTTAVHRTTSSSRTTTTWQGIVLGIAIGVVAAGLLFLVIGLPLTRRRSVAKSE
jgi:hypothetical protein